MTPPTISQMMFGVALILALAGLAVIVWTPDWWWLLGCYLLFCAAMAAGLAWFLRGEG